MFNSEKWKKNITAEHKKKSRHTQIEIHKLSANNFDSIKCVCVCANQKLISAKATSKAELFSNVFENN